MRYSKVQVLTLFHQELQTLPKILETRRQRRKRTRKKGNETTNPARKVKMFLKRNARARSQKVRMKMKMRMLALMPPIGRSWALKTMMMMMMMQYWTRTRMPPRNQVAPR